MDKRERVLACMNHLTVDRPPVGFWFHFSDEQKMGAACVQAHLDYYNHVDVDLAKIMCDGYFDYPNPLAQSVQKASDWYHLKPLGKDHPYIVEQVERARRINEALKGECCTFYNIFSPYNVIREAFENADATVMAHLREDPDAVNAAARAVGEDEAELAQALIQEGGMTGIYQSFQAAELDRFTAEGKRSSSAPCRAR